MKIDRGIDAMFKSLGKYFVIIITTVLFLFCVVSILGLNFYMSYQVESNAEAVNVAGRQRMLSQRVSKSLLNSQVHLNAAIGSDDSLQSSLEELKGASAMFNTTLNSFQFGGEIIGTNGESSYLAAVTTERGKKLVVDTNALWRPFYEGIQETLLALQK